MRLVIPFSLAALLAVPTLATPAHAKGPGGVDSSVTIQMSGGRLGAQLQNLTDELRAHFGAPQGAGVLVARVEPDSPAAKAGLRAGDVLVDIDGARLEGPGDAIGALVKKPKGASAQLGVIRAKQRVTLSAALRDAGPTAMGPDGHGFGFDLDGDFTAHGLGKGAHAFKMFGDLGGMQKKIDALEQRLKELEAKLKLLEQRK